MSQSPLGDSFEYRVRPMDARDRGAILELSRRLLIGVAPWVDADALLAGEQESILECLARDDAAVFVAEVEGGRIVGFVTIARQVSYTGTEQAYLGELVVAEDVEGRGLGTSLMSAAEAWARERGFRAIVLDTGADNLRARGFYQHLGYAEESVRLAKMLE